jgi:hypothetical protein
MIYIADYVVVCEVRNHSFGVHVVRRCSFLVSSPFWYARLDFASYTLVKDDPFEYTILRVIVWRLLWALLPTNVLFPQ